MIPKLSHAGPVPVYQQIRDWMYDQIASNAWPEHYKLLAETDLADTLEVSRGTVRKAISELIADGLLVQIHGRGTFVSSNRLEQPLADRLVTFSEDLLPIRCPSRPLYWNKPSCGPRSAWLRCWRSARRRNPLPQACAPGSRRADDLAQESRRP